MNRVKLPDVTLIVVDTINYGEALFALQETLKHIVPARVIFFTDVNLNVPDGVEIINIKHIFSTKEYSKWMIKELGKQDIKTSHILVIQADGYVLDGEQWTDEFLKYDWLGAPWLEIDGHNVGNGGFSIRSFKLHQALATDDNILPLQPEDTAVCRIYRNYLELKYGFTWAPEELADKFSFELRLPRQKTFGFHQHFHKPFKEYVVIRRYAAMGDVIQVEPILRYFHEKGYNVVLDSPLFYEFFVNHYFPVLDFTKLDPGIEYKMINLDMSYETNPKQLHLKSYFETCGIKDYKLSNPKLNWVDNENSRLFQKYVVIHIDQRETTHRNQYGIDWIKIKNFLEHRGYVVIQIGSNDHEYAGIHLNTTNKGMLLWAIGGCSLYIGIDSGPATIAVALERKCILLFGTVNPAYIHADLKNVTAFSSHCPISEQYCWHEQVSVKGRICPVSEIAPPCCIYDTDKIIQAIKLQINDPNLS